MSNNNSKDKTIQTPWGQATDATEFRKGLNFYGTESHGGYHLNKQFNKMIAQEYRNEDGWYEEDCEALKVEYFLADIIQPVSESYIQEELEDYLGVKLGC